MKGPGLAGEERTMFSTNRPTAWSVRAVRRGFGEDRRVSVSREITKKFEQTVRGTVAEVLEHFRTTEPKGEFVIVVAGKPKVRRVREDGAGVINETQLMEENRTDDTQKVKRSFSAWLGELREFMKGRFSLDEDKAQRDEVVAAISKGVVFRGVNLWVLIFATMIASLGLNVNSAAVIIGAMLISPIMGPIMGVGLALGINDFELLKKALRNYALMFIVAIITSTVYFFISPLSSNSSELLARTVPTTYDVLIALFGGLAGIVAQTRQDRTSTVIPGVAIATALIPPPLHGGLRSGDGAVPLLRRRLLPLFHQLGLHRAGDLCHGPFSAIREERLHRQGPRAHGQAADDGYYARDFHSERRHRFPYGPRLAVRSRGRQNTSRRSSGFRIRA